MILLRIYLLDNLIMASFKSFSFPWGFFALTVQIFMLHLIFSDDIDAFIFRFYCQSGQVNNRLIAFTCPFSPPFITRLFLMSTTINDNHYLGHHYV